MDYGAEDVLDMVEVGHCHFAHFVSKKFGSKSYENVLGT